MSIDVPSQNLVTVPCYPVIFTTKLCLVLHPSQLVIFLNGRLIQGKDTSQKTFFSSLHTESPFVCVSVCWNYSS